jgi:hypothetical protein
MITERPNADYDCTMGQLYVIARSGWKSHMDHLTEFSGFSTLYTLPFATAALAEIDAAAAMPMFQERNEPTEETYTLMKNAAALAVKRWKYLRNYIRQSYAKELRKGKWESAGMDHYEKASNHNWSELLLMMTAGSNFITANAATLSLGGMPGTFAADYAAARSGFAVLQDDFIGLEQGEKEGTDEKVIANNAVYRKMMDMFEDGQLLFEDLPATRDRFIFQRVKETVTQPGGGQSGTELKVIGILTNASTAAPMPNMNIQFQSVNGDWTRTVMTDSLGRYSMIETGVPADTTFDLVISVNIPGFVPFSTTVPVSAGESYLEDIALTPVVP